MNHAVTHTETLMYGAIDHIIEVSTAASEHQSCHQFWQKTLTNITWLKNALRESKFGTELSYDRFLILHELTYLMQCCCLGLWTLDSELTCKDGLLRASWHEHLLRIELPSEVHLHSKAPQPMLAHRHASTSCLGSLWSSWSCCLFFWPWLSLKQIWARIPMFDETLQLQMAASKNCNDGWGTRTGSFIVHCSIV